MAMPYADQLAAEMQALRNAGVDEVVCLMGAREMERAGLAGEATAARAAGIAFTHFAIGDMGVPGAALGADLVRRIANDLSTARSVVVHCRAGIGRTGLVIACVLREIGLEAETAMDVASEGRGAPVPQTAAQRAFVINYEPGQPSP